MMVGFIIGFVACLALMLCLVVWMIRKMPNGPWR